MKKLVFLVVCLAAAAILVFAPAFSKLNLIELSAAEQKQIDSILAKTELKLELMKSRNTNPNWLELSGLRAGLSWQEKLLLGKILRLTPADLNIKTPRQAEDQMVKVSYEEIKNQPVMKDGKPLVFLAI